jgi:hypothetical protein
MLNIYKGKYNQFLCTNSLETDVSSQTGITFQIKEILDEDAAVLVELKNIAAGGSDNEIAEVDYTKSSHRLKFDASDVDTIEVGYYWGEAKIIIGGKEYMFYQVRVKINAVAVA